MIEFNVILVINVVIEICWFNQLFYLFIYLFLHINGLAPR